jgi:hypothetical protein
MKPLWLDFETYYDDVYSLKKMTPIQYILDPRFEALGCGFVDSEGNKQWVDGPDLPAKFASIDWPNTFAITHNALFDALILALRYRVFPGFYGDTLSMARNWISHATQSISLDACCKYYGMAPKMTTLLRLKGVNFHQLQSLPELHREAREYGVDDAVKCRDIFNVMVNDGFPLSELEVIDLVIRMTTQPRFELDPEVLHLHLAEVQRTKQELLDKAQLDNRGPLMSDATLAAMLMVAGIEAPTKISKTTGKQQYAFAKTDKEFTALLEHDDPWVQALVAARIGHKSTIEETRSQRLIDISRVTLSMPVPLKYSGAHTHRFSGDWSLNVQNFTRGGNLRKALKAPKGYVVVAVDASQIEARFNSTISGQDDLTESFRAGNDVYAEFAEEIYRHPVNKNDHPRERFVGKTGILSLGYGSSPPVFQGMCRNQGGVLLSDAEAANTVWIYRQRYQKIVENWKYADQVILPQLAGVHADVDRLLLGAGASAPKPFMWGPMEVKRYALSLPSGNFLRYRDLRREQFVNENGIPRWQWMFMRGNVPHKIYGAKVVENVCQALSFVHIMQVAVRIKNLTEGMVWPAHQVHDELIYVVPENVAEMVGAIVQAEMAKSPVWLPTVPLAAEVHIGANYGEAK